MVSARDLLVPLVVGVSATVGGQLVLERLRGGGGDRPGRREGPAPEAGRGVPPGILARLLGRGGAPPGLTFVFGDRSRPPAGGSAGGAGGSTGGSSGGGGGGSTPATSGSLDRLIQSLQNRTDTAVTGTTSTERSTAAATGSAGAAAATSRNAPTIGVRTESGSVVGVKASKLSGQSSGDEKRRKFDPSRRVAGLEGVTE